MKFKILGWCDKGGILNHGWASLIIIAFIQFWMWYGNTMIVLCAGILGINPSLYEAASVDGASSKQQFFKITLPLLKPILQYTLVTSAIGGLHVSAGGTQDYGKAAAYSVMLFAFTLIISLLFYKLTAEKSSKDGK